MNTIKCESKISNIGFSLVVPLFVSEKVLYTKNLRKLKQSGLFCKKVDKINHTLRKKLICKKNILITHIYTKNKNRIS